MTVLTVKNKQIFSDYVKHSFYDEMFDHKGQVRGPYEKLFQQFSRMGIDEVTERNFSMQSQMMKQGITFTLYDGNQNDTYSERTIPFDIIPRIVTSVEWELLEVD
ncbi:hypothetical protein [Metabacillus sediminilitoris]|uniref:Uncharacterized protein n=1 Tax=Metabacillus sediminilitoris TaxID=2567941 RepID=A0A4S4BVY8_9BACI|nr:hypothetical protein [Metabacillus sediminilitoris]QGQ46253.1 hypothetical protein GMB29_14115 [Metabacillus sediminilitoris]THF79305.1 hypothetical protein E6W99_13220 [Metabacillus sediminilitoris]